MSRADYEIAPEELQAKLAGPTPPLVLDVRRPDEVALAPMPAAMHLPMDELQDRLDELDPDKETVIVCHHGVRSLPVAVFLRNQGLKRAWIFARSINLWSLLLDP